ncbi:MAG: DUF695 domain-containing protein [Alphaproteobacteria bacterium]|nr:DUF695 domain-containing protein [Alphaproteobacteria bacterium]
MSQQWDFYFCRVDGQVASILIDLGLLNQGVDESKPTLLSVRLPLLDAREDGLTTQEEAEALNVVEDRLATALEQSAEAVAVGRLTTAGYRELFFYGASAAGLREAIGAAIEGTGYRPVFRSAEEPDWSTLFDFLAPDDDSFRWILDRRVLDQLVSHGDDPRQPRPVDHYAYFADAASREAFLHEVRGMGFEAEAGAETEAGLLGAHMVMHHPVLLGRVHPITSALVQLAKRHGGDYDGWGSPIVPHVDEEGEE